MCIEYTERIEHVVRSVLTLRKQQKLIVRCFDECGLMSSYKQAHKHFNAAMFSPGLPLRDSNLSVIIFCYVQLFLSIKNLRTAPSSPLHIPEESISENKRALQQYISAGIGFRKFFIALG